MSFSPSKITNPQWRKRDNFEKFTKKQTHKYRRRIAKEWLRDLSGIMPEPNDKQFFKYTT